MVNHVSLVNHVMQADKVDRVDRVDRGNRADPNGGSMRSGDHTPPGTSSSFAALAVRGISGKGSVRSGGTVCVSR